MRMSYWTERVKISLRQRGLIGTVKKTLDFVKDSLLLKNWRDKLFDQKYKIQTSGRISQYRLGVSSPAVCCAVEYRPTPVREFVQLVRGLDINYADWTFIDVGAGKGRALLLASRFPFKRIIGVDFSPNLIRTATENITRFAGDQKCEDISVVLKDASEYEFPSGDLLIYLNNPFHGEVMEKFVRNLERCYTQSARGLCIVYWTPFCRDIFDRATFLTKTFESYKCCTYRSRPRQLATISQ